MSDPTKTENAPAPTVDKNEGKLLNPVEQAKLRKKIQESNLAEVSRASHAGEMSLTKAAAAIPVQRGTVSLIREYLAKF